MPSGNVLVTCYLNVVALDNISYIPCYLRGNNTKSKCVILIQIFEIDATNLKLLCKKGILRKIILPPFLLGQGCKTLLPLMKVF